MKNKKNINKSKLPFFLASVLIGFLIVFGLTEGVLAQTGTGLSVGAGNNNLILEPSQNIYYGVSHYTSSSTAGLILLQTYNGGKSFTDRFKVEASGNVIGSGKMALGGAAIDPSYTLNITGNVNSSGFCIAGDCRLSWGAITGTSFWNQSGSNLYASSTTWNVGIGTASPVGRLSVYGTGQTIANITDAGNKGDFVTINSSNSAAGSGGALIFGNSQSIAANSLGWAAIKALLTNGGTNTIGDLAFLTRNAVGDTSLTERMRILANGNIGIGTSTPGTNRLYVSGTTYLNGATTINGIANVNSGLEFSTGSNRYVSYYGPFANNYFTQMQTTATAGYGTYGPVTSDWALYNRFSGANTRGWIWQLGTASIAALNGQGNMQIAGNFNSQGTGSNYFAGSFLISTTTPSAAKLSIDSASTYSILAGMQRIGNVADPFEDSDVVTKGYLDAMEIPVIVPKPPQITVYTAAAEIAKTATVADYTLTTGDLLAVKFTNGNTAAAPTLEINGSKAKNIRLGTTNANTTVFTIGAGATALLYYDGTYFQMMGSQRTSDNTVDANMYHNVNKTVGVELTRYKIMGEGVDGKYYPFTNGNTTAGTKTVSIQEYKPAGTMLYYNGTATVAANALVSNTYTEINTGQMAYTFNQSGGYTLYQPIYLVGTINASGNFVLDNSTLTSFYTQTLPSSEDGKVYIYLGHVYDTNTMRFSMNHPIYEYRNGRIQLYEYNTNFFVKKSGDTMTGNLTMPAESFIGPSALTGLYFKDSRVGIGTTTLSAKFNLANPINNYNMSAGYYRIGNLMDPDLDTDAATKGYVLSAVSGISVPGPSVSEFGYWGLNEGTIYNRDLASGVGVNTVNTDGVTFAVAQGSVGFGSVSAASTTDKAYITGSNTKFLDSFRVGDYFKPTGLATSTITAIYSNTAMKVSPAYSSNFYSYTYNIIGVPPGDVGALRFVVKGSGQVGIGTIAPQASLHISSDGTNELSDKAIIVGDASSSVAFAVSREGKVTIGTSTASEMLNIGGGKIYLASTASSSPVEDRLYNTEGQLYWGNTLIGSASSNPWRLVDSTISASSSEWKVAIGSSTSASEALHLSGRLFLGDMTAPAATANRLYSMAGKLYWDGKPVGADATTTWAISGNNLYSSSTAWNVAIGLADAGGYKLNVLGNSYFNGNATVTGRIYNGLGLVGTPSYAFNGDTNTGIYSPAADQIAFSTGGTARLTMTTAQFTGTLPWRGQAGTAAAPAFSFSSNTNTGMYRSGTNQLSFSSGGTQRLLIDSDGRIGIGLATIGSTAMLSITGGITYGIDLHNAGIGRLTEPFFDTDAATKYYVDHAIGSSAYLPLTGTGAGSMTGDIDMGGKNISNIDEISAYKLNVTVIDPLYTIGGVSYATFGASFAGGLKEEYSGKADIKKKNTNGEYELIIDFRKIAVGSDLWLWYQVVDFSRDNVEVVSTPYGKFAAVYYLIEDDKLIFRSDRQTEISYRLTGRRFDWRDWPTKTLDQSVKGIELKIKK